MHLFSSSKSKRKGYSNNDEDRRLLLNGYGPPQSASSLRRAELQQQARQRQENLRFAQGEAHQRQERAAREPSGPSLVKSLESSERRPNPKMSGPAKSREHLRDSRKPPSLSNNPSKPSKPKSNAFVPLEQLASRASIDFCVQQ